MKKEYEKFENMSVKELVNEYEKLQRKNRKILENLSKNKETLAYLSSKIKAEFDKKDDDENILEN